MDNGKRTLTATTLPKYRNFRTVQGKPISKFTYCNLSVFVARGWNPKDEFTGDNGNLRLKLRADYG